MNDSQENSVPNDTHSPKPIKKENTFLNLGFNILIPILILNKGDDWFGDVLSTTFENTAVAILLIAIAFPILYFIYDLITRKKYNFISILGLISVLLTGGIGILEIPTEWFAIKEAAIPAIIGIVVIASLRTPFPIIRAILMNPELMDVDKIDSALARHNRQKEFNQLLSKCTYLFGLSFLFSAILNYVLARWIVVSPSGSDAYNAEVSKMMLWSWPAIAVPSLIITFYALWVLIKGIQELTGFKLEEIIKQK